MRGRLTAAAFIMSGALAAAALAQHADHAAHQRSGAATSSLTAEAVQQLLDGEGMGLARAAELNGYPGPKHVLELEGPLALTAAQKQKVESIRQQMLDAARPLGRSIVEAERALDAAFVSDRITEQDLASRTAAIGQLQAQLRAAHLHAHLLTKALLTKDQVARYVELRRAHH